MKHVEEGDLLTVRQAQAILPVGRSTLYKLVEEGQIPSIRVRSAGSRRGRVLVRREGLEEFIEKSRQTAPAAPIRVDVDGLLDGLRRGGRRA